MQPQTAPAAEPGRRFRNRPGIPADLLVTLMLGTCSRMPRALEQIRARGVITVATRNSPLSYYEGAAGPEGPEYELARAFAERLGVRLELTLAKTAAAALEAVSRNRAQLAAAGLVAGEAPRVRVRYGPV